MNKTKQATKIGNDLVIKYQVSSLVNHDGLNVVSSKKLKLLALYKRFYKLRNMIDAKPHSKETYQCLVRRKFTMEDFAQKRGMLLDDCDKLTETQVFERMINTLAFVHNSTVYLPSDRQAEPVFFFRDLQKPQRVEKLVLLTMLKMDEQKPPMIKYDRKYEWITNLNHLLSSLSENPDTKEYKSTFKEIDANLIGFRDYELNLMRLNECYSLCL